MSPFEKTPPRKLPNPLPGPACPAPPAMDASGTVPGVAAVGCLPIPDSAAFQDGKLRLRLCVLLRPTVVGTTDADRGRYGETGADPAKQVSLAEWPWSLMSRLRAEHGGLRVVLRLDGQPQALFAQVGRVSIKAGSAQERLYLQEAYAAQAAWMQAFNGGGAAAFAALYDALDRERHDRLGLPDKAGAPVAPPVKEPSVVLGGGKSRVIAGHAMVPDTRWLGDQLERLHVSEVFRRAARTDDPASRHKERDDRRDRWTRLRSVLSPRGRDEKDPPIADTDPNAGAVGAAGKAMDLIGNNLEVPSNASAREIVDCAGLLADGIGQADPDQARTTGWRGAQRRLERALRFERPDPSPAAAPSTAAAAGDPDEEPIEAARRRLLGFQSHPTLAKLVRLMLDVEIEIKKESAGPFDDVFRRGDAGDWLGEVRVEFTTASAEPTSPRQGPLTPADAALVPTRFRLSRRGELVWFQPASRHEETLLRAAGQRRDLIDFPARRYNREGQPVRVYVQRPVTPLQLGFLELRHHPGRYRLTPFDTAQSMDALMAAGRHRDEALQNGARAGDVSDRLPALRTMGVQLVDTCAQFELQSDIARTFLSRQASETGAAPVPLYADDLLLGYRVDVERIEDPRQSTWSSATARRIHYPGLSLPAATASALLAVRSREHGSIQATMRLLPSEGGGGGDPTAVGRQEMFTWTGDPLGLPVAQGPASLPAGCRPRHAGAIALAAIDGAQDLDIAHDFDFDETQPIPALRLGADYRFVLRACFLHGGGPEFRAQGQDFLYEGCCLGHSGSAPGAVKPAPFVKERGYRFTTTDPVGAPDLALLTRDAIVQAASLATDCPGERLDQVVLRWDGQARTDRVRRVFLPPRVGFEVAEQQRQFDRSKADIPQGALLALDLEPATGTWPQAVGGRVQHLQPDATGVVHEDPHAGAQRGPVVRAAPRGGTRQLPFYCDVRGRRVAIRLSREGVLASDLAPTYHEAAFWAPREGADDALPLLLEFRLARPGFSGARFDGPPEIKAVASSTGLIRVRVLPVEIGLAEDITVEMWCPDEEAIDRNHALRTAWAAAVDARGDASTQGAAVTLLRGLDCDAAGSSKPGDRAAREAAAGAKWQAVKGLSGDRPLDVLNDVKRLKVVAAVKRPLSPPQVARRQQGGPALGVVRLQAAAAADRWHQLLAASQPPTPTVDLHACPDELGGDVAFLHGVVDLHRPSTGSLQVEMAWEDWDDERCVSRDNGEWTHRPRARRLAHLPDLAVKRADDGGSPPLSLAREGVGAGPDLSFPIGTCALAAQVVLTAESRFRHCFAEASPPRPEEARSSSTFSLWLPSTLRPPAPTVSGAPEPIARQTEIARSRQSIVVEVSWSLRVTLAARSWFKSGVGELLALVFKPETLVADASVAPRATGHGLAPSEFRNSDFLRRLDVLQQQPLEGPPLPVDQDALRKERSRADLARVTGWGVDPATDAGRLDAVISPAVFSGWTVKRARVPLPFRVESVLGPDTTEMSDVSIIAYEAALDAATGERIVDVDLAPSDVDTPFLRLSVARFQPRALRVPAFKRPDGQEVPAIDLSLSPQVVLDPVPWPSMRRVELDLSRRGLVRIRVQGPAYCRRAPTSVDGAETGAQVQARLESQEITDVPWMRIRLMRLHAQTQAATVAVDDQGREASALVPAVISGRQGRWECVLRLPDAGPGYRIYLEEVEFHVASDEHSVLTEIEQQAWLETPRPFKCDIDL